MRANPDAFLKAVAPYREDFVVAVECMFTWNWLADLCRSEQIAFVLGHALYMKAIHGGKAKNDRIDAHKIATLLRGGMIPRANVYPPEMRATRDLLRRRLRLDLRGLGTSAPWPLGPRSQNIREERLTTTDNPEMVIGAGGLSEHGKPLPSLERAG
jgi:hypothetical protein